MVNCAENFFFNLYTAGTKIDYLNLLTITLGPGQSAHLCSLYKPYTAGWPTLKSYHDIPIIDSKNSACLGLNPILL